MAFDEKKANRVRRFIECLKHTKGEFHGKPFKLLPWQDKIISDVFGTVRDDDPTMRQYTTAYIEIPKKQGTVRNEQRKPRKMTGRLFSDLIYALMEWDKTNRYKILGYKIEFEGEELFVFDLKIAEIFECSTKARKTTASPVAGEMGPGTEKSSKVSRRGYYSPDIENTFGLSIEEHRQAYSMRDLEGYVTIGALTEETNTSVSPAIKMAAAEGLQDRGQE